MASPSAEVPVRIFATGQISWGSRRSAVPTCVHLVCQMDWVSLTIARLSRQALLARWRVAQATATRLGTNNSRSHVEVAENCLEPHHIVCLCHAADWCCRLATAALATIRPLGRSVGWTAQMDGSLRDLYKIIRARLQDNSLVHFLNARLSSVRMASQSAQTSTPALAVQ